MCGQQRSRQLEAVRCSAMLAVVLIGVGFSDPRLADSAPLCTPTGREISDGCKGGIEFESGAHTNHSPVLGGVGRAANECPRIIVCIVDNVKNGQAILDDLSRGDGSNIRGLVKWPFVHRIRAELPDHILDRSFFDKRSAHCSCLLDACSMFVRHRRYERSPSSPALLPREKGAIVRAGRSTPITPNSSPYVSCSPLPAGEGLGVRACFKLCVALSHHSCHR